MKESNNQLDGNQLTEDIDTTTEEINMDPSLELVKAPKGMKEAVMRKIYEHEHPEIFDGLSEEDKKALWLGREMLAKEGESKKDSDIRPDTVEPRKTKKKKKFTMKVYGLVAAVAVAMVAIGITSVGGPRHLAQMVDEMFAGRSQINVDSVDGNIPDADEGEEKAYQKIKDSYGFDPIRLYYKPLGMQFQRMEIDDILHVIYLTYTYKEKNFFCQIIPNFRESVYSNDIEDKLLHEYEIKLNDIKVKVREYKIEGEEGKEYSAQFMYNNVGYIYIGRMDEPEEFIKIIQNLKFF